MFRYIVLIFAMIAACQAVKIPSYFQQCKKDAPDLNNCLKTSANKGFQQFIKGDPSLHVIPLNPLHIKQMSIDVKGSLKINLTESDISGIDTGVIEDISWDFNKKNIKLTLKLDKPSLSGTYDIDGKILILPITGHGPCNITFVNTVQKLSLFYDIQNKQGKEYVNIIDGKLSYTADRMYFLFDNLFNGDQRLAGEMNKFLDENWKEIDNEIGPSVGNALAKVFTAILKSFMERVPMNELFG